LTTFVDASALLAVLDAGDTRHAEAASQWRQLVESGEELVTSSYVLVESFALIQRRLGLDAVQALQTAIVPLLRVLWLGEEEHAAAVDALFSAGRKRLSLVDCASVVIMLDHAISRSFTLDSDFAERGFDVVP
jgi:uncharacterized protein